MASRLVFFWFNYVNFVNDGSSGYDWFMILEFDVFMRSYNFVVSLEVILLTRKHKFLAIFPVSITTCDCFSWLGLLINYLAVFQRGYFCICLHVCHIIVSLAVWFIIYSHRECWHVFPGQLGFASQCWMYVITVLKWSIQYALCLSRVRGDESFISRPKATPLKDPYGSSA